MTRLCLIAAIGCLAAAGATAQTVYRCGSEYTRVACAEGRLIDVSDPVTAEQRADALAVARRERQLGESMARERRAEAAALRPLMAANVGPAKAIAVAAPASKKKSKTRKHAGESIDGDFVARVPKTKKTG